MFLVLCLFISAFDSSQPRDVDKMSGPLAFYLFAYVFHYFCSFFPLRFLSLSFPLYLFFVSLYYMLLYISPCLIHMIFYFFDYCLPLFFSLCPFSFPLSCVSFIAFKSFLGFTVYHVFSYCFCCFRASDTIPGLLKLFCNAVSLLNKKYFSMGKC